MQIIQYLFPTESNTKVFQISMLHPIPKFIIIPYILLRKHLRTIINAGAQF